MTDANMVSSIAEFRDVPDRGHWPAPHAMDVLIRECARTLCAQCRVDFRRWLSEGDLQSLLYAILRRELPAYGIPSCAVHTSYAIGLPDTLAKSLNRRHSAAPLDLVIVVPSTIRIVQGRHWQGQVSVGIEVKRGCERYREIKSDLAKLAAVKQARPDIQVYMVVMGFRNQQKDLDQVIHAAAEAKVPLLWDNYWSKDDKAEQPELP